MIKFQSLPRHKRQAIRDEVLRMYAETDMSYGEIAEVNGVQLRTVEYIIRNFASEFPETPIMRKNKQDVKNILVLQNWLERIRKEVTNKVLSIKRISDFLIFPILAQPTLKKI